MEMLLDFIRAEAYIVVLGMALAIGYQLLCTGVRSRGLLAAGDGAPSASATTLLLVTGGGAVYVVAQAARGADTLAIPSAYLYLLGGGCLMHLAGRTQVVRRLQRLIHRNSAN